MTEVSDEDVSRMAALFAGNEEAHGTHAEPEWDAVKNKWGIKSTARTIKTGPTPEMWREHLIGTRPLGVVPISQGSVASWGSIDIDVYDDTLDLPGIITRVKTLKYPLIICRSKSGGIHLFLFLSKPEPAAAVQSVLNDISASLGLSGCEIFPKQVVLVPNRDHGNWMVMPYFGGDYDGKLHLQHGIKDTLGDMTLGEFLRAAENARTTVEAIQVSRGGGPRPRRANGAATSVPKSAPFANGPPCLQALAASKVPSGGRDNTLFMMGIYFKKSDAEWRASLEEANRLYMDPPAASEDVLEKIKQLARKDYDYTCKTQPMQSYCNKPVCRSRQWGVGDSVPKILSITKWTSEPPIWILSVEGAKDIIRVEVTTEVLRDYRRFCDVCLAKIDRSFAAMKQADWQVALDAALEDLIIEEAPDDTRELPSLRGFLSEFLTNKWQAQRMEDLVHGRSWQDTEGEWGPLGDYYLSLKTFMEFLAHRKEEFWNKTTVPRGFKAVGGRPYKKTFPSGDFRNLWQIPCQAVERVVDQVVTEPEKLRVTDQREEKI